ncbi:LamG domain-containing protein, partial [Calditrichota bacterium]
VHGAILTVDRFGKPNSAYFFDGIDDYIDTGNDASLKPPLPITVTMWVKYYGLGQNMLTTNFNETNYHGIIFGLNFVTGYFNMGYGDGGGIGPSYRRSKYTSPPPANEWFHIAAVIRGAEDMDIYFNGVDAGGTYAGSGGALAYDNGSMNIGRYDSNQTGPPGYFYGILDQIRLYNRALNGSEIFEDLSLPVKLSSFSAKGGNNKVILKWETSSEINNQGFILKRANTKDGEYQIIAHYESDNSLKGAGNTSSKNEKVLSIMVCSINSYHIICGLSRPEFRTSYY